MADERTPLLWDSNALDDPHKQFCALTGVPPSNSKDEHPQIGPKTLYGRATKRYAQARRVHSFMTALSNTLLLSQVVLGATLTALGASGSSHILITAFGVINTVIAGLVAYLKSRGQPARQRIFRDDLERVVDEIENSEIMWLGIAQGVHGYDEIDIDDKVTVRSEVARLIRFYEKAVRNFAMSNPDNYLMGQADGGDLALRPRGAGGLASAAITLPVAAPAIPALDPGPSVVPSVPAAMPPVEDPDESPASAPTVPTTPPPEEVKGKGKEPADPPKDAAEVVENGDIKKPAVDSAKDKPAPTAAAAAKEATPETLVSGAAVTEQAPAQPVLNTQVAVPSRSCP